MKNNSKKSLSKPKVLKGKNVAPKKMPKQVTNKSPQQFVYNTVPKPAKKGSAMLAKGMSKLAAKK